MSTILALVFAASLAAAPSSQQSIGDLQRVPRHGDVRSIASFTAESRAYVAVLYWVDAPGAETDHDLLVILETGANAPREVFRLKAGPAETWMQVRAFPNGGFAAFVVERSESITNHDGDLVVARTGAAFAVVYNGSVGEYVDVNSDGREEVLESQWPDGDGFPTTTRVHVWNGKRFVLAGQVPWKDRLSAQSARLANRARHR